MVSRALNVLTDCMRFPFSLLNVFLIKQTSLYQTMNPNTYITILQAFTDRSPSLLEYELAFALPDESPLMELINKGLITMKEKNEILPAWRNWIAGPCTGIGRRT